MVNGTIHFKGLNALRFFAAFAIIIYHSTLNFQDNYPKSIKMLLHNLPLGVDLFFIISGFLIVYLLIVEREKENSISLVKFYTRRILRIFPLYYLIIAIAWFQFHETNPEIDFTKYLYFAGNFWMIETDKWTVAILNPLWSLCIEEHFYLVIPFLITLIPLDKLKYLFFSIIAVSIFYRAYITFSQEINWMSIYAHTLSRCDLIAAGGLIAYYHHKQKINLNIKGIYLAGAVIYLLLIMSIVDNADFTGINNATFKKYLFAIPLVFIFCGVVFNNNQNKVLNMITENKLINYLGKISFGLYMYHSPIGEYLLKYPTINNSMWLKLISISILTIAISSLSYEIFEKQILKLKSKFETVKTQI